MEKSKEELLEIIEKEKKEPKSKDNQEFSKEECELHGWKIKGDKVRK